LRQLLLAAGACLIGLQKLAAQIIGICLCHSFAVAEIANSTQPTPNNYGYNNSGPALIRG
jgi:hypothetical protein